MRAVVVAVLLSACGRIGFDATSNGRDGAPLIGDGIGSDTTSGIDAGLPSGLVSWFPFDPIFPAADVVGMHGGDCLGTECPANATGHIGTGKQFDGVDDCISVPDAGQLQLPQITLAIWANQTTGGTLSHVSKRVLGGSVNAWQLETEALGMPALSVSFTTYDGSGLNQYARSGMNTVVLGTWQHLAATYDGATKRLYINGVEAATMPQSTAIPYDNMPMLIGCDDNAPRAEFFAGTLDDLQIYDRALSASEIADLAAR